MTRASSCSDRAEDFPVLAPVRKMTAPASNPAVRAVEIFGALLRLDGAAPAIARLLDFPKCPDETGAKANRDQTQPNAVVE
jgi:hypothetical protein